jgi:acyl carrier protein
MTDADSAQLKHDLKQLIIDECDKDMTAEEIADGAPLLGGTMDLDSLDVLQICMAIKNRYGVRIEGSSAARKALKSIDSLAEIVARESSANRIASR